MSEIRLLSATPILGYGFPESAFEAGLAQEPHMIGADGGSTDPGPYYLGSGKAFCSRVSMKRDLRIMIKGGVPRGIPVVVGTSGGAGGEPHLQMMADIVREIASEEQLEFKLALIRSELDTDFLIQRVSAGKVHTVSRQTPLSEETIREATRIVGLMGPEPYIRALDEGAQVILAGRSTDPAPWAAVAIRAGLPPAQAWYAGKMLECGSEPAVPKREGCLLARITAEHVDLEPTNPNQRCTTLSVANFALHENKSPIHHLEPGGMLDTSGCAFEQISDRVVRVSGMRWQNHTHYTVKLEGVRCTGYRAITICASRDPILIRDVEQYLDIVNANIEEKTIAFGVQPEQYRIAIRSYGRNGVMGVRETTSFAVPHEMAFVVEVQADTQDLANAVIGIARLSMLHSDFPGRMCREGNMAIPFSPSDISLGLAYEFSVFHIVEVDDPNQLFPVEYVHIGASNDKNS
ncbi:MAG: acyclic terpene utilization AtuA family protein [Advenella sp.]